MDGIPEDFLLMMELPGTLISPRLTSSSVAPTSPSDFWALIVEYLSCYLCEGIIEFLKSGC
jgi:hypothetical protein